MPTPISKKPVGQVSAVNNLGVKYPAWHAKNPRNAVVVAPSVVPTKTLQR